ncbi:MAG: hypothetical protein AB4062_13455 [Crocosphaera sp.]
MKTERSQTRIVIMGAAGRDFHNFNQVYLSTSNFLKIRPPMPSWGVNFFVLKADVILE